MSAEPSKPDNDPLGIVGTVLDGRYKIEALAGQGGFGHVYRAVRTGSRSKSVAIKFFKDDGFPSVEIREHFRQKFSEEADLLDTLGQCTANIVRATDHGTLTLPGDRVVPYFVMDWLEGETLHDQLRWRRNDNCQGRSLDETLQLLDGPARALEIAHDRNVAHRDIKPGNLFVVSNPSSSAKAPVIKILDFGIARAMEPDWQEGDIGCTTKSVVPHSAEYAAPEQAIPTLGRTGPWSDVYSFALVVREVLTDCSPREWASSASPGVSGLSLTENPIIDKRVQQVFAKALNPDPNSRYRHVRHFWNALGAASRGEDEPAPERPLPTIAEPEPEFHPPPKDSSGSLRPSPMGFDTIKGLVKDMARVVVQIQEGGAVPKRRRVNWNAVGAIAGVLGLPLAATAVFGWHKSCESTDRQAIPVDAGYESVESGPEVSNLCEIGGVMYEFGATNPSNPCQGCSKENKSAWTARVGAECGDAGGTTCGADGQCQRLVDPVISAGGEHTCMVTPDGSVKCWGENGEGQLGDGSRISRSRMTLVSGLGERAISVSAGSNHTCAITASKNLWCWGFDGFGQLGDGTDNSRLVPTKVEAFESNVIEVSAGGEHTCAFTSEQDRSQL